jgi:hypothetical protein
MRLTVRFLALLMIVALSGPVRGQESGVGRSFGKELLGNEMNPALSLILEFTGAYFSQYHRIGMGGHAPTTTGFNLTGAELAASANVDPYFRFDMAFCFGHMHLEEFYLTTLGLPLDLQLRAGLFLARVGRHNNTHPHSWNVVLHPLSNQFLFGSEGFGAPGVELAWLVPLPWYAEVTAAVMHGQGGAFRTKPLSSGEPGFQDFVYPARWSNFFDLSDDWGFQVAANAVFGPSTMGTDVGNRSAAYGLDFFLKWRPIGWGRTGHTFLALAGEGWFREMEVPKDVWRDVGGFLDLIWGMNKRWQTTVRGELWRRMEGQSPASDISRTKLGLDAERGTVALTFLPSHFSKVRIQYSIENIEGYDLNHVALVQVGISAGTHGAHAY